MIVALDADPDVVAVVPTLGRELERLRKCLESVLQSSFDGRLSVLVVWNDPRRPVPDLGQVTVLEPGINLGFPIALNAARKEVSAPFLWIVQDDQTVASDCLQVLFHRIQGTDRPAIVRPVVINDEGKIPATSCGGTIRKGVATNEPYPSTDITLDEVDQNVPLDWVTLSGALVRCEAWDQVGGMDPMFFPLQWSDIDLGYRMTKMGIPVILEPNARVTHERFGSTPSLFRQFLSDRNQDYFLKKIEGQRASTPMTTYDQNETAQFIAREASLLLIDFASHAEDQIQVLMKSPLMRLTRPLRALSQRLRRIRQE